jgi:hypothetical protein
VELRAEIRRRLLLECDPHSKRIQGLMRPGIRKWTVAIRVEA